MEFEQVNLAAIRVKFMSGGMEYALLHVNSSEVTTPVVANNVRFTPSSMHHLGEILDGEFMCIIENNDPTTPVKLRSGSYNVHYFASLNSTFIFTDEARETYPKVPLM